MREKDRPTREVATPEGGRDSGGASVEIRVGPRDASGLTVLEEGDRGLAGALDRVSRKNVDECREACPHGGTLPLAQSLIQVRDQVVRVLEAD